MRQTVIRLFGIAIVFLLTACGTTTTASPTPGASTQPTAKNTVFLKSAIAFDPVAQTITLPIFKGVGPNGGDVWYIVTESSDFADAQARGVNFAHKLVNALNTKAVQRVTLVNGVIHFTGTVNFGGKYVVTPSKPNGFPPETATPGAVGDANYSPLITTGNGIVLNASQVANSTGQHAAATIDTAAGKATLKLLTGFGANHFVFYLRTDGSVPLIAALEASTLAPNLNAAPAEGSNDSTSARSAIIPVVNGPRGANNPKRQGLESALLGEGPPQNITQTLPADAGYSPVWDVTGIKWTDAAVSAGQVKQLTSAEDVAAAFKAGQITSVGKGAANASLNGVLELGAISDCSTVAETV